MIHGVMVIPLFSRHDCPSLQYNLAREVNEHRGISTQATFALCISWELIAISRICSGRCLTWWIYAMVINIQGSKKCFSCLSRV